MSFPLVRRINPRGVLRLTSLAVIALAMAGVAFAQNSKTQSSQTGLTNLQRLDIMRSKLSRCPVIKASTVRPNAVMNESRPIPMAESCDRSPRADPFAWATASAPISSPIQPVSSTARIFGCCPILHVTTLVPDRGEPTMKIGRGSGRVLTSSAHVSLTRREQLRLGLLQAARPAIQLVGTNLAQRRQPAHS